MEVVREADKAIVYVEIESNPETSKPEQIFDIIGQTPNLIESRFIDTLPQEERENRFRVVLDNISDGVISIGKDGQVTTINKIALKALNRQTQEVVGNNVRSLNLPDHTILECLQGKTFNNAKKDLITEKGRFQYLANSRPIKDSAGHIIGAVEIAKDVREIKNWPNPFQPPATLASVILLDAIQLFSQPSRLLKKSPKPIPSFPSGVQVVRAKSCSPGPFIPPAVEKVLLSPSIARLCPSSCWRANCSAMPEALLPVAEKRASQGCLKSLETGLCFYMKLPKCRCVAKLKSYG